MENLPIILDENLDVLNKIMYDGIVIHRDGKFVYLNEHALKELEADSKEDLIGKSVLSIIKPQYLELVIERLKKLEKLRSLPPELIELTTIKGNSLFVEISTSAVIYENQLSFLIYSKNLNEIVKKNNELANYQSQLNAVIKSIPDILFIIDKDLIVKGMFANDPSKLFLSQDKVVNKNIINVLPPHVYLACKRCIEDVFDTKEDKIIHYEAEFNNRISYFEFRATLKNSDEVLAIVRDVSKETQLVNEQRYTDGFQQLLTGLAFEFLNTNISNFEVIINSSLEKLAKFLELDDITFVEYELNKSLVKPIYKWGISDKANFDKIYTEVPTELFSNWITSHFRGSHYFLNDIENSKVNKNIIYFFSKLVVSSHLSIPIFKHLECIGFISLEKRYDKKQYSEAEIKLINIFAKLLGNLFSRLHNLALLEDKNIELEKAKIKNNRLIKELRDEILERKQIEEELSVSKRQLEATIQNSPVIAIQWYNNKGEIIFWNKASEQIFGYSEKDVLGKTLQDLYMTYEEHKEYLKSLQQIEITNKPIGPYESQIIKKDGTIGWLLSTTFIIPGKNQENIYVCMDADISKQKELFLQLSNVVSEKDKFLSIIAHDLKSPFTGFLGMTQMLSNDFHKLNLNEIQEISGNLYESAENLYKLLENLLEWSRLQRGLTATNKEELDIYNLVNNNINLQKIKIEQKEISIRNKVNQDLRFFADMNMVNAILRNFISNAVKFTNRGGSISIYYEEDVSFNIIVVEDNGIGIPDDIRNSLFTLTKKVSRLGTEGELSTGLGLILCKEYVEKHNGKIWVQSTPDHGSKFYFSIPKTKF
ncbi:MAG TPA: PAS domain S-box protein [Candidatus Kapabacteria bacterium]|nr:PAS domain S-box protein [Candidatus Kapabacteria bacterium]